MQRQRRPILPTLRKARWPYFKLGGPDPVVRNFVLSVGKQRADESLQDELL